MDDLAAMNTEPVDLTCPFCRVPLVGGPRVYDCPQCQTFSRMIPIPKTLEERVATLVDITAIQLQDGNWNYNDYMRGMANGLLLAQTIMTDTEYTPLYAPGQWLENKHDQ